MLAPFLRLVTMALLVSPCQVPERIHLSSLIFGYGDNMNAVVERLKHESFDHVAASLPDNYAKDGWFQRSQLAHSQYAKVAVLAAGQYAVFESQTMGRNITRVDEVRPAATCDNALRVYPNDPWALSLRAAYEARQGNIAASIADYSRQIANNPKSGNAYLGRAQLYFYSEHQYRRALDDADRAIDNNERGAYVLRATIESTMGDDDLAEADASSGFAALHGAMVDESPANLATAVAYADLGYFKPAIEKYNLVLAHHPGVSYTLALRGFAKFASGDDAGAKIDLFDSARENLNYDEPLLDLTMIYFTEGNAAQALEFAERAHGVGPKDPYTALWLAIVEGHAYPYTPPKNAQIDPDLDAATRACESAFYRGITYYEQHQKSKALPLLRTAATTCPYREHERVVAKRLMLR